MGLPVAAATPSASSTSAAAPTIPDPRGCDTQRGELDRQHRKGAGVAYELDLPRGEGEVRPWSQIAVGTPFATQPTKDVLHRHPRRARACLL